MTTVFTWDDGFLYTAPVGTFKANAFGLHDMPGNAWKWCQVCSTKQMEHVARREARRGAAKRPRADVMFHDI